MKTISRQSLNELISLTVLLLMALALITGPAPADALAEGTAAREEAEPGPRSGLLAATHAVIRYAEAGSDFVIGEVADVLRLANRDAKDTAREFGFHHGQ